MVKTVRSIQWLIKKDLKNGNSTSISSIAELISYFILSFMLYVRFKSNSFNHSFINSSFFTLQKRFLPRHFISVNYFLFFFTTTICPIIKINVTPKPLLRKSRFSKYSIKIPIKLATNATMIILAYGWFFVYFFQFLYKKTHSSILFRL